MRATGEELGGRLRFLVGKPGLDGHSNGAEQIAVRARDAGFEVVYQGIRLTPAQIVVGRGRGGRARRRPVGAVRLAPAGGAGGAARACARPGLDDVPVVVGGIIPDGDARRLRELGVARVFTPKDFGLTEIMGDVVDVVREANGLRLSRSPRWPDRSGSGAELRVPPTPITAGGGRSGRRRRGRTARCPAGRPPRAARRRPAGPRPS